MRNLLKRYQFYKIQAENGLGGSCLQKKLMFLENSISVLNEEDYKLIKTIYIDGISVAKAAKILFCARQTVYNRCEKIIGLIAEVYDQQLET